jgi:hypothetical protein
VGVLALVIVVLYLGPIFTFGGTYYHSESKATYEFRDGRFYENGKDLSSYSIRLRTIRIYLDPSPSAQDMPGAEDPIYATIGWNTVEIPLLKYGNSLLIRETRPLQNNGGGADDVGVLAE